MTRNNIAFWTGRCGDPHEALRLFEALSPDEMRIHGADDPDTLQTRNTLLSGLADQAIRARRCDCSMLLPDWTRVAGLDHRDTLKTRNNIGIWTGECGDAREALRLSEALLPGRTRVLGPDHPDTPTTRNNIAWTGRCGDPREAWRSSQALLTDRTRVLGIAHKLDENGASIWMKTRPSGVILTLAAVLASAFIDAARQSIFSLFCSPDCRVGRGPATTTLLIEGFAASIALDIHLEDRGVMNESSMAASVMACCRNSAPFRRMAGRP